jgi:hypothetical protein
MVGTFALAVLQDADEIASALRTQEEAGKLDWSRARIVR